MVPTRIPGLRIGAVSSASVRARGRAARRADGLPSPRFCARGGRGDAVTERSVSRIMSREIGEKTTEEGGRVRRPASVLWRVP
ncbi:MAG: hypothetical protein MPL62_07430 [Alphaproteobacteria bacterium]|nr:hypothetical protein [Alphaproteobacteria bacterium]